MELTEKKLKGLFDYQTFRRSRRLEAIIADTERRYGESELSDEDLSLVSAAGGVQSLLAGDEEKKPGGGMKGLF